MESNTSEQERATALVAKYAEHLKADLANPAGPALRYMGTWLADVLLDNQHAEVFTQDLGYDFSSYGHRTNKPFDLTQYENVGDFLACEATGNTVATYCSGSGFAAETYDNPAEEHAREAFIALVREKFPELLDPDGWINDYVLDELYGAECSELHLMEHFKQINLMECFLSHLSAAIALRHQRAKEESQRAARKKKYENWLQSLAGDLPLKINAFAGQTKFEKHNWKVLLAALTEMATNFGKARVGAALRFAKIHMSNSVAAALKTRFPEPKMSDDDEA